MDLRIVTRDESRRSAVIQFPTLSEQATGPRVNPFFFVPEIGKNPPPPLHAQEHVPSAPILPSSTYNCCCPQMIQCQGELVSELLLPHSNEAPQGVVHS